MKRAVLDTNIIVSSALGGVLVLIFEKWDEGKFIVIVTNHPRVRVPKFSHIRRKPALS